MTRLVEALKKVGQTFELFQKGEIGPCESTPSPVQIPNLVPSTFCRVPVEEKHITRGLVGMFFETDKTFLLPSAMRSIRMLNRFYRSNPGGELLVVGHTDTVGPQNYNLELSKRRAENMAAYLEDRVEIWTVYYQPQPLSKQWGTREDQYMLSVLPEGGEPFYTGTVDGIAGPSTKEAITKFQGFSNANRGTTLTVDGIAGPDTRRELVKAYMELDGTSLPEGTPLFTQGCGEFHPEVPTGDEVEEPRNRRVEVFFFPDKIDPPMPVGGCRAPGCIEYPQWRNSAGRTIDFTKELGSLEVLVRDEATGQPLAEANVAISGIESRATQTDGSGKAFFEQLIQGEYTLLTSKDGFKTKTMPVTVAPGKASAEKSPAPGNQQSLVEAGDSGDLSGGASQAVVSLQALRDGLAEFIVNVKEHPAGAPPPATGAATAFSHGDPGYGLTDLAKEVKRAQARPFAVSSLVLVRFAKVIVGRSVRDTPLKFREAGMSGRASASRADAAPQAGKAPEDLRPSVVRWRILEGTTASNREQLEIFPGTTDLTIATRCRLSLWADTNFVTPANLDNPPGASGSIDDLSLLRTIKCNKSGKLDFVRDQSEAASNDAIRLCHERGIQVHAGWGSTPRPTEPTPANPHPPKNDGEERADHFNRWMTDLAKAHVKKEDGRFVMGDGAKPEIDRVAGRIMELCKLTDEGPDSFDGFGFDVEGMKNEPFEPSLDKDQRHLLLRRIRVIFTEFCRELARCLGDHGKVLTVACAGVVNHTVDADGQPDFYEGLLNESFSLPVQQIWSYHAALGHPNFIIRPMAYDRFFSTRAGLRKWHHDIVKYAIGKVGLHPGQFQLGVKPGQFETGTKRADRVNSTEIRERCKHLFRPNRVGFIQFALGKPVAFGGTGNNWSFWNGYNTYLNGLDFTVTDREPIAPTRTLGQPLQGPLDKEAVKRLKQPQSQTLVKKP
jgi:outer membrane protein OmpA-like peptidoglycan-associated protein